MKTEYLITFDEKDLVCKNVKKFKQLLNTHDEINIQQNIIKYKNLDYPVTLATGKLTDGSIYYDLVIESNSNELVNDYSELLREIRKICQKISGRQIIILYDGLGEYYCNLSYPKVYKIENLMRKLISKFMAISVGYDWTNTTTPKEVTDSIKGDGKKEKTNILMEVDFIQLSKFLFTSYTTNTDSNSFIQSLKGKDNDETIKVIDLKKFVAYTNWERYFETKVQCDSNYIKSRWERLYDLRCKIAHCKGLTKTEYDELLQKTQEIEQKIESALASIDDIHIDELEREQLAENLTGSVNNNSEKFLEKYNNLQEIMRLICLKSSSSEDAYLKHETNRTNIKMQADYLYKAKCIISELVRNNIIELQIFRNKLVHNLGLVDMDPIEIHQRNIQLDKIIEELILINPEELEKLKSIDNRFNT
ncbi:HEPN domain-containing protein [Acinetobacter pittii]|uniref:HEPN domain-containing protein n=1 Tax=Acinetobacter pittii TaxID=48296 RepID=UPI0021CFC809|nr:HEPN domain-containing protein [Acinetobacter pittii]MCU4443439.1 hypothetical protein [Acinetobacter pittii]